MRYSIDTSALLDGWKRYYPPDVMPGVWSRLDDLIADGSLRATEEVLIELDRKDDDVYQWAKKRPDLFVPVDDQIQIAVTGILAEHEKLLDTRSGRSAADPFVVALAQIEECTVITGERRTRNADRPNIPDVCDALDIPCITLLDLMRAEGWTFDR